MSARVIVGMSGGVDSSVAALILMQQGYEVECVFMKNWEEDDDDRCTAEEDYRDALMVCDTLDLPLRSVNFSREYWDRVFEYFLQEYRQGRTPNPDILCNKEIKFKAFLDYALELGADYIATGHYARIEPGNQVLSLYKGLDPGKDQSYFLYLLGQEALAKSLFPIGKYKKRDVRKIADEAGLLNATKKDSTGLCFIGEQKFFKDFLKKYIPTNPGEIITIDGTVCGEHEGLMYYTLGQRKGLGIGGGYGEKEAPWFVADKHLEENRLVVVQGHDHSALYHFTLTADQLHWISGEPPSALSGLTAKIRYRQSDQPCIITDINDTSCKVKFEHPQFAITPGQSVVFYRKDECLGGGIINNRESG